MPRPSQKPKYSVGLEIRAIRKRKNLKLEEIANQTGFAVDYLKGVETGKLVPNVAALLQISKALGINARSFLHGSRPAQPKSAEEQIGITQNYTYTPLTPTGAHTHLKSFHITIEPRQSHQGIDYQHEGEEFVFVLNGKIELTVGDRQVLLTEGEAFQFNSMLPHKMCNLSKSESRLIVAIYIP